MLTFGSRVSATQIQRIPCTTIWHSFCGAHFYTSLIPIPRKASHATWIRCLVFCCGRFSLHFFCTLSPQPGLNLSLIIWGLTMIKFPRFSHFSLIMANPWLDVTSWWYGQIQKLTHDNTMIKWGVGQISPSPRFYLASTDSRSEMEDEKRLVQAQSSTCGLQLVRQIFRAIFD